MEDTAKMLRERHPTSLVLRLLHCSKANYYRHLKPKASARAIVKKRFDKLVSMTYHRYKGIYGAPKIQEILRSESQKVSLKRVQRAMKRQGLKAITIKKWRHVGINQYSDKAEYLNLLNQDFHADLLNQKWSTDITYIHTQKDGWCYLSSLMDLCSRKIIAWKFSKQMTTDLVIETINLAAHRTHSGLILQTDRGSQYTSTIYENRLQELGIKHSYSKKGYPYDNSVIETFHASLKKEEVYQNPKHYLSYESAKQALFAYIEGFYNRNRIHSAIQFKTPQEVELFLAS